MAKLKWCRVGRNYVSGDFLIRRFDKIWSVSCNGREFARENTLRRAKEMAECWAEGQEKKKITGPFEF
jgi:hypothetical protein